jgi:hypothetical protein
MITKQLAKFRELFQRFNLAFCRSGRTTRRQYLFPGKSRGAKVTGMTGTARHLFKGVTSLVGMLTSGPDLEGLFPKAKSLGVLAAMTGFFGRLRATSSSVTITVGPAKKIGCLVKSITALTEQFSNLLTEMPFF